MVRLNIDFVGPFDDGGYILVIIDCFTRWVELYACAAATAKEAARCLLQHFGRYGCPSEILSDNGSHFVNELIAEFLELVGVHHQFTVAYSKEENAIVERANKEVNRNVRHICYDRRTKSDWRNTLPIAQRILNAHHSKRTRISPASILFGNAVDLDRGIFLPMPEHTQSSTSLGPHMAKMLKTQSTMMELHRERLQKGDEEHLEKGSSEYTQFDVGAYVLLDPASGKPKDRLHSRRMGPFLVLENIRTNSYKLQNLVTKKEFVVNIHRMHPFYFDEKKVDPQEVAAHDAEEFLVESILSHRGGFNKKSTLEFQVRCQFDI
jgi:hypothetical protein